MNIFLNGYYTKYFYINADVIQISILESTLFPMSTTFSSASMLMTQTFNLVFMISLIGLIRSNWLLIYKMTPTLSFTGVRDDLFIFIAPIK